MSAVFTELKRLINRSGMSSYQIARRSHLDPLTIRCWLDGKTHEPRLESLLKVAALFGRRVELINGEARIMPDTPASVAIKARQARDIIGYWRRWQ